MKSDTERKKYYSEKLHKRKNRLHVHLSKELRGKLKSKKRAILVHSGDLVRVMRGPNKGKDAKVGRVSTLKRKVYLEGVVAKNARGREVVVPIEPSNLMLIGLESTPERKKIFSDDAFKKEAPKKQQPKKDDEKNGKKEAVDENVAVGKVSNEKAKENHTADHKEMTDKVEKPKAETSVASNEKSR
ncbi:50S ribosomal protein L24 [Candidatus Micrarchaeota archaeon]|nr:50S ribosomal protein L24 [Candidatus Micrarchaeota archaeon]MBU1165943.1 50S ribosomal protein L24 [Candidatus Micrarchaeota archaeon]MBU1886847.1 50S ribosomal protein L24 [Candidatus Micrarchaeota archaeon]